jgi:preprotein translocase subunit YajC
MTSMPAVLALLAATKKTSFNPTSLILLLGVAIIGYFFFIKPQQRKAAAARAAVGTGYEVGDEVQTIGGVIGTILEINGDRYTLLTGHVGTDGNLEGAQPTRIVFVRQAIARKVDPVVDVEVDAHDHDVAVDDDEPEHDAATGNGSGSGVDDAHEETEEA